MWMRWNDSTHIFEMSTNDGASWAVLPLNASVINEGSINASRLPATVALTNINNNFSTGQNITGNLIINGSIVNSIAINADFFVQLRNTQVGNTARCSLYLGTDNLPYTTVLFSNSSSFSPVGLSYPNGSELVAYNNGGLSIYTQQAAPLRLGTNTTERLTIDPGGTIRMGSSQVIGTTNVGTGGGTAISVQNQSSGNSCYFAAFYNSAAAMAGVIQHTGAITVAYASISDKRLKIDKGLSKDLTALRLLEVHDFVWEIDKQEDRGLFAQDAYKHHPRAILPGTDEKDDNGNFVKPWMADLSKLIPDLIVGWQEHDREIVELKRLLNDKNSN